MSKVTIKFYNTDTKIYVDDDDYMTTNDGRVYCMGTYKFGHEDHDERQLQKHIEPHFFVNGERIS